MWRISRVDIAGIERKDLTAGKVLLIGVLQVFLAHSYPTGLVTERR